MIEDLSGKVAVVTGGASGIGFALAQRFLAEKMAVVVADVERAALVDAVGRLRATGGEVLDVLTDVADPEQVESLAARCLDHFGAVHLVCNNAGVGTSGAVWEISLEDWDWVLGVNLRGVVNGIRSFVPRMLAAGEPAHVVNTASLAGLVPLTTSPTYTVSKFGIVALSEILYLQLQAARAPVGVSVLCPGWVRTRLAESHRNRPDGAGGAGADAAQSRMRRGLRSVLAEAMDPAEVADEALDAVRTGRFYVLPHDTDEWLAPMRARFEAILAQRNPTNPVPPGSEVIAVSLGQSD